MKAVFVLFLLAVASAAETPDGIIEEVMRKQIFLDENNIGPGVIDGRPGRVTDQAVAIWRQHHPEDETDEAFAATVLDAVPELTAFATVPDIAKKYVDPNLPSNKEKQAKLKALNYRSYAEFMAERYHTTETTLARLNSWSEVKKLKPRSGIKVPAVTPFLIEEIESKVYKKHDEISKYQADVDTEEKRIDISRFVQSEDDPEVLKYEFVGNFPITPGKPQFIRYGEWNVKNCVTLPNWRYDKSLLKTGVRSDEALMIPPGPNNPVGIIWVGLTRQGIGIHGTSDPQSISRSQSAGCIRTANWDAIRLADMLRPGSSVLIR